MDGTEKIMGILLRAPKFYAYVVFVQNLIGFVAIFGCRPNQGGLGDNSKIIFVLYKNNFPNHILK